MRHAVLTPFFGRLRDRFCEYQGPLSIDEKLERAAAIPGVEGVEIVFPDECGDAAALRVALARLRLEPAAINVNLKGHPDFVRGALSSPDAGVRRRALELICQAKELALAVGAQRVTCAPLADGYDYPFQTDYRKAWTRTVDVLAAACDFLPGVSLHLEHKPSDPRVHGLLDTAARVVCLCRDIQSVAAGITFNVGHAFCGGGNPADAFALVLWSRLPYYIHFCDGTEVWDWDLVVGSRHYWQWAEFLFYLKEDGYDGWIAADTFPVRQNASEMFAANIRITERICRWLDTLDTARVRRALEQQELFPGWGELEQCLPQQA
jgi:xylose isomerase